MSTSSRIGRYAYGVLAEIWRGLKDGVVSLGPWGLLAWAAFSAWLVSLAR